MSKLTLSKMTSFSKGNICVGFGWLVDEVVWACAIVVLSVDVDI